MNQDVRCAEAQTPEFEALLLALREEKNMISEVSRAISSRVNTLRGIGGKLACEPKKPDEFAGKLGVMKMELIGLQESRRLLEEIFNELCLSI
jgi:hypothetical protein